MIQGVGSASYGRSSNQNQYWDAGGNYQLGRFVDVGLGGRAGYGANPAIGSLCQYGMQSMANNCAYPANAMSVFGSVHMMSSSWGYGYGFGQGYGSGQGYGYGFGQGYGYGFGQGYGYGFGQGYGQGVGNGWGVGIGNSYGFGFGWGAGSSQGSMSVQVGMQVRWDMPPTATLPEPICTRSGPPAGKGLSVSTGTDDGWPTGTIKTAGGYHIYPEGNTNWNIYGPGQKYGDTPTTRVWGDPHVKEADGTTWDFTGTTGADGKTGNDFVLGDGTRIFAETSSDKGQSVTTGLVVTNGADRVTVSNVDGTPCVGQPTHDGYEWRAQHVAMSQGRETFRLGGNGVVGSDQAVQWARERHGVTEGLVTGSSYVDGRYDQNIDSKAQLYRSSDYTPAYGTPAWGNSFRSQLDDTLAQGWADRFGPYGGSWGAVNDAMSIHRDHYRNLWWRQPQYSFGGWGSCFRDPFAAMNSIEYFGSYFGRLW